MFSLNFAEPNLTAYSPLCCPSMRSMGRILSLLCVFLFSRGFLRREFTDRREIWHEASSISQTGLLKFWGRYPRDGETGRFLLFCGAVWGGGYAFC